MDEIGIRSYYTFVRNIVYIIYYILMLQNRIILYFISELYDVIYGINVAWIYIYIKLLFDIAEVNLTIPSSTLNYVIGAKT